MRILIPVLVGSLIGYLTNWLAIKMLFKPHYEKKILGITVPFTPGLIPKERNRIAENIGNAVGIHLLSTDTIMEAISNSENEKKIKNWINEKIENLRQETMTVDEYLESKIGGRYKLTNREIDSKISDHIIHAIRNEKFKKSLHLLIDENIDKYDTFNLYRDIEIKVRSFINNLVNSDDIKDELESALSNLLIKASKNEKTLGNIIPYEIFASIEYYLDENQEEIGDNIREILKDSEIQYKIKDSIADVVFDRSNKFVMAFVSSESISEKIFESIEKYMEKEETNEDIIEIIKFLIEKGKLKEVSSIANSLNNIIREIKLEPILDKIINNIFKDENIDKSIDELLNLLRENENSNKETIKGLIWDELQKIISSEYIESKIKYSVQNGIKGLANKNISDLFKKISDNTVSNIYIFSKKVFHQFAKYELPRIIEMLDVSKIVTDKINSFEIDYTEKLILDIARKELNQITRLGALLGGILGLLSPLFQYIY